LRLDEESVAAFLLPNSANRSVVGNALMLSSWGKSRTLRLPVSDLRLFFC